MVAGKERKREERGERRKPGGGGKIKAVTQVPLLQSPATMKKVAIQLGVRGGGERRSLVITTPPASTQNREARIRKSDTTANTTHSSCGHEIHIVELTVFVRGSFLRVFVSYGLFGKKFKC